MGGRPGGCQPGAMKILPRLVLVFVSFFASRCLADDTLDFLLGDWDIFNAAGKQTATTKVEATVPGVAITEIRRAPDGRELKLWYFYSEPEKAWKSVFVGPNGATRELVVVEKMPDGSVQMLGRFLNASGPAAQSRFTYYKLPDGSVRRHLEASEDDGKTWKTLVDATYRKKS